MILALGEFPRLLVVEAGLGDGFLEDPGIRVYAGAAALDHAAQSTIPSVATRERTCPHAPHDLHQPPRPLLYSSLLITLPTTRGMLGSYAKVYTG